VLGLEVPPDFDCLSGVGRAGLVRSMRPLEGLRLRSLEESQVVVLSVHRDSASIEELRRAGWVTRAELPLESPPLRRLAGRLLARLPGQEGRVWKILAAPGLVVLARPRVGAPAEPPPSER
jgi:hypothetical protein